MERARAKARGTGSAGAGAGAGAGKGINDVIHNISSHEAALLRRGLEVAGSRSVPSSICSVNLHRNR